MLGQMDAGNEAELERPFLEVEGVYKIFSTSSGSVRALADCSFTAADGEFVSIVGPSGCGKSTLLMMIAGLASPTHGSIRVGGKRVSRPLTDLGIAFQSPVLLPWRTALGNVMLQLEQRNGGNGDDRTRAGAILEQVGLTGFEDKLPAELSGGMQQRVALCRALVHEPKLLLMDEPFAALDAITRDQLVLDLQRMWQRHRSTVVFVTHSLDEAVFLSDRVIVMTPRPGMIDRVLTIDLPRPRRLRMREEQAFVQYSAEIRQRLLAQGVLDEHRD
jgi:NitT/TauT family transport system ATP-binding protein